MKRRNFLLGLAAGAAASAMPSAARERVCIEIPDSVRVGPVVVKAGDVLTVTSMPDGFEWIELRVNGTAYKLPLYA